MADWFKNLIRKTSDFFRSAYVAPVAEVRRFMKESGSSLISALRHCRQQVMTLVSNTVPVLCAAVFMTTACTVSNTVLAYEVSCNGKFIGYVTDSALCEAAAEDIKEIVVAGYGSSDYIPTCGTKICLASASDVLDKDSLREAIVLAADSITDACGIYSSGRLVAVCSNEAAAKASVQHRLDTYRALHPDCGEISIAFGVEFRCGLYPTEKVMSAENVRLAMQNLSVMESVVKTYSDDIDYNTLTTDSPYYMEGVTVVQVEGKKGKQEVTANVCYIDGIEVSRETLETTVVTQPVDEVIAVGTREVIVHSANKMIWPIDGGTYYVISARWGDGRDHQAVDIACERGTAILAAKGGVVVETTYNHPTYGRSIVIDHGEGIQTRYAHCQTLKVAAGDEVEGGQVIATVGNTGRSSGPHLHFEYMINGIRVNPCPYLGI